MKGSTAISDAAGKAAENYRQRQAAGKTHPEVSSCGENNGTDISVAPENVPRDENVNADVTLSTNHSKSGVCIVM